MKRGWYKRMKRCFLMSAITTALILTGCSGGDTGKHVSGTADDNMTYVPGGDDTHTPGGDDARGDGVSVGIVGKLDVKTENNTVSVGTGDVSFSLLAGTSFGIRNGTGAVLLSKSGTTAVSDAGDEKNVITTNWSSNGAALQTGLTVSKTSIGISQKAKTSAGGISGVQFSLRVPDKYNIIVPYQNGIRLTKKNPGTPYGTKWSYGGLSAIQMQMFIIEGENGGAVIYADDAFTQFKELDVRHSSGNFTVLVTTVPQAPFTEYKEFGAVEWKIIPYVGNWSSGAAIYRDFAREKFELDKSGSSRPEWVKDIGLVVLTDMHSKAELDALAKKVDPKGVLLQVPDWRVERYDINWPDYTPQPGVREMIEYAHSLGFRVQLHCNMNGCQTELPAYRNVKRYHMKDAFTGKEISEDFTDVNGTHYHFAQINPASSEWRSYVIAKIVAAVKETGADAVHLDQSLLSYNDGNGYVDGLTSLQGNVLYQKELAEALPEGVAIGGEGITDFNAVYSTFLQSHVYGLDSTKKSWSHSEAAQIVPITSSVFTDTVTYQWPGLPVVAAGEYYLAWYLRGTAIGHIPTLMRESPQSILSDDDIMKAVLSEARWFTEKKPERVYGGWDADTIMRWRLKDGTFAQARRDKYGYVLLADENDSGSVLTRILSGTVSADVSGSIQGWNAYNDKSIICLDPDRYYLVSGNSREEKNTVITSASDGAYLTDFVESADALRIKFAYRSRKTGNVTFTVRSKAGISYVYSKSGKAELSEENNGIYKVTAPVGEYVNLIFSGLSPIRLPKSLYGEPSEAYIIGNDGRIRHDDSLTRSTGSFGGKLRKKVTVSVPALSMNSLDYIVALPDSDGLTLSALVGTQDALYSGLPVSVSVDGETVWRGALSADGKTADVSASLSNYRGKTVVITLCVDGRQIDGITHSVSWCDPVITGK